MQDIDGINNLGTGIADKQQKTQIKQVIEDADSVNNAGTSTVDEPQKTQMEQTRYKQQTNHKRRKWSKQSIDC